MGRIRKVKGKTATARIVARSLARRNTAKNKKMNNRIRRVENILRKTLERKYADYLATVPGGDEITNTAPVNKAAFFRIADTGSGESKRIGNKVNLLSQRYQCNLIKGGPGDKIVRVLIVNNSNYESSATINPSEVLEYSSWTTDGFNIFTSPYKMGVDASKRYQVYYDKVFSLTDERPYVKIDVMKRFGSKKNPGKVCDWEVDTSDFPNNHRVTMLALTDHTGSTNAPRITMFVRNKYIDA